MAKHSEIPPLTRRERQIVELIWKGMRGSEISARLKISPKTVEAHRANVMKKWRVRNSVQLIKAAIDLRILRVA